MKPTGLLAACGVLAVLGGLVWWTKEHPKKPESTTADAPKVLALGEDQIEEITLSKPGADPIALKKSGGKWQITAPQALPADQDTVKGLVSALANIQSDRLIDLKPENLAAFGLTEPKAAIEVKVAGGTVNKVLLGGENPSGNATYAKLAANPAVYTILSATRTNLDKSITDLRDKRMLTFDRDKVTAITVAPAKGAAFEFARISTVGTPPGEWQVTKPRTLRADTGQVDDLLRRLVDTKMDLSGEQDEKKNATEFTAGTQLATVTVRDAAGTQAITVHKTKENAYYGRSSAVEGTYKLTADLPDGLKEKELDSFRNKKVFEFGFNDPTKVEINGGAYQKSADKWTGPIGQTDPASVQAVIDKLRDLAATKFADKAAAGVPALTLAITSGDKNKLEKITLVKTGDTFTAQREGDAEGYILDSQTVEDLQKTIAGIKPFVAPKPAAQAPEKK